MSVKTTATDQKGIVNVMYCFGKRMKNSTQVVNGINSLEGLVDKHFRCIRGPPPEEEVARNKKLADIFFDLGAKRHERKSRMKKGSSGESAHTRELRFLSQLLRDVLFLLGNVNDKWDDALWITHYCWCLESDTNRCCESDEDAKDKVKAALANIFYGRSIPIVTLSRWTYVLTLLIYFLLGLSCHGLFVIALAPQSSRSTLYTADSASYTF